jgi:hypothetical protein
MNKERLNILANHLDRLNPKEFDMHSCNTCIGGHAERLFSSKKLSLFEVYKKLGMTCEQGFTMFFPTIIDDELSNKVYNISNKEGALVVRHFIKTEEVNFMICPSVQKFIKNRKTA